MIADLCVKDVPALNEIVAEAIEDFPYESELEALDNYIGKHQKLYQENPSPLLFYKVSTATELKNILYNQQVRFAKSLKIYN